MTARCQRIWVCSVCTCAMISEDGPPKGWAHRGGALSCSAECFAELYELGEEDETGEPPGAGEDVFERAMRARYPERDER